MPQNPKVTIDICQRWLKKAGECDDSSLAGAFDKYFSLFVAFNSLYSYTARLSGRIWDQERIKASEIFSNVVGNDVLSTALTTKGGDADLRDLRDLIGPEGPFYLIPDRSIGDQLDRGRNCDLHRRLESQKSETVVRAILEYLFYVRCNMFHGSKDFDKERVRIIKPASRCLERVISVGLQHLGEEEVYCSTSAKVAQVESLN